MAAVTGVYGDTTLEKVYQQLIKATEIKDRKWLGFTYKNCANAKDMVDWLCTQPFCESRAKGVEICQELQKQGAIVHVWCSKKLKFKDTTMFFRFDAEGQSVSDAYDLVVIGGGSAGISATSFAATFGASVLMVEGNRVGGDCTWSGCVPSKSLIKVSHDVHGAKAAQEFGVKVSQPLADMKKVKDYVWEKIHTIAEHDLHALQENDVPLRYGKAKFLDPHTVELTNPQGEIQKISSRSFILCLGAVPAPPPIKGLQSVDHHTYETIFHLEVLPKRMCVVGGGVIGCEMAQAFARLGAEVTLVASKLLAKEVAKVDIALSQQFDKDGIRILRGRAQAVEQVPITLSKESKESSGGSVTRLTVVAEDGSTSVVETDLLLVAAGRRPNTLEINLAAAGVAVDEKTNLITVSSTLQTTAPHIYAAGDCCTLQQFTHYASIMGVWAARNLLLPGSTVPTHVVPRVTFTTPEVASVGLTEEEALAKGFQVVTQPSTSNERAICENDTLGFIDVYLDKSDRIVGACLMNNRAGELLAELLVAMENKMPFTGLALSSVVHPYPTYSWATMMLATEVKGQRVAVGVVGKVTKWLVTK